jgi:hypothetical protein
MKYSKLLLVIALFLGLNLACTKDQSAEIALQNGISGSITRFTTHQNYLYALNLNEVLTYDISNADKPKLVSTLTTDYGLETITIYDGYIYLGSATALYILGIDNPAAPVILSKTERLESFSGCDPVVVKGNYAYSTIKIIENICGNIGSRSALIVYDVTDKTRPRQINIFEMSIPNGLAYSDDYLFVCDEGYDRIEIFDINTPFNVKWLPTSVVITDPVDLIINGTKMIVSTKTNFEIYDISDLANIKKVGIINK